VSRSGSGLPGAADSRASESAAERELIARVLGEDDRGAFAELVRRHQSAIRSVLRRLTRGDLGLADDLAQECFLHAYLSLASFRGEAVFRTWLYRIACNLYFQHRRRAQAVIDAGAQELQPPEDAEATPEFSARSAGDLAIDIGRAMGVLSDAEREAIVCCYFADLSHGEAATTLGLPLGTVKSHLLRARQKLRVALGDWRSVSQESTNG
jgi:RNA polymerase sigma factor (sigma-70 family)